jgi:hypothetical protein
MKRASAVLVSVVMAFGVSVALQGCGSEDSKPRRSVPVKRAKSLEEMTPEERAQSIAKHEEAVRDLWIWPGGEAPRDPNVDAKTCSEAMHAKPGMSDTNPLVKLTWQASCMKQKGWEMNPDSKLAQGLR